MKNINIQTIIVVTMTFFTNFNFFHTMNTFKNITKLFICGFAIVGMTACGGGGNGGGNDPINITDSVNLNNLSTYTLQNLNDTAFFSDIETEITGSTDINQITITISNNSDASVTVEAGRDDWKTEKIDITSLVGQNDGDITVLTITITYLNNGAKVGTETITNLTITVVVTPDPPLQTQTLTFNQSSYSGTVGNTIQASASGEGTGAISYTIANTAIATINASTGVITPLTAGQTIITATIAADSTYDTATATAQLIVALAQQNFAFDSNAYSGKVGDTIPASASGEGTGAISYMIDDTAIATIDAITGEITLLTIGTATITATIAADGTYDTATATATLTVGLEKPQTLTFNPSSYDATALGDTIQASASGEGTGTISYSIANTAIATIDDNGEITPLTAGETIITATIAADITYDTAEATADLTVVRGNQTLSFNSSSYDATALGSTIQASASGDGTGTISYSIENTAIATIDASTGVITPLTGGQTIITATIAADSAYNTATATADLNVALAQQNFAFDSNSYSGTTQDSIIQATASGEGTGAISYTIDDTAIATIDAITGVITPLTIGTAIITATIAADGTYDTAEATATLIILTQQTLTFGQSSYDATALGDTIQVSATGQGTGTVSYTIANIAIATIDDNGEITPLTAGQTIITATIAADSTYDTATATADLIVALAQQNFAFDSNAYSGKVGDTIQASASGEGTGAISYMIDDTAIATIDASTGVITPLTIGTAIITATIAADNTYDTATATATLNVGLELPQTLTFNQSSYSGTALGDTIQASASGEGTGDISYRIANTAIATINANTGEITPLTAGETIIIATIAADSTYDTATATADLNVALAQQNFAFEKDSYSGTVGNTIQVRATGQGSGTISYTTASTDIATIDDNGEITPLTGGQTIITATITADSVYDTTTATATLIILTQQTLTFGQSSYDATALGDTIQVSATGQGTGAISYTIDDTAIATIDATGVITPLTGGQTTITASIAADSTYDTATATTQLNVALAQQNFAFDNNSYSVELEDTIQVSATGQGTGAISYTIDDTDIATIDDNGVITPLTIGTATITATIAADNTYNTATATAELTVNHIQRSITFTPAFVSLDAVNDTAQITIESNGSTDDATYMSNNEMIATVNGSGLVTAVAVGQATITVRLLQDDTHTDATSTLQVCVATVDCDGDGLIEINSLTKLHNMRYNLDATSYKTSDSDTGVTIGCPSDTCSGYELTTNLDFDLDGDGSTWSGDNANGYSLDTDDSNDVYFPIDSTDDTSAGWLPIGTTSAGFTGVFDGNGNTISNLAVMRNSNRLGLFGQLAAGSVLRNLVIDNALIHALGNTAASAGVFVGEALGTNIAVVRLQTLFATGNGTVIGNDANGNILGGIVGNTVAPVLTSSYSTVKVQGGSGGANRVGGIVGSMTGGGNSSRYVAGLYATGAVTAGAGNSDNVGGLIGFQINMTINDSYSTGDTDAGAGNTDNAGGLIGSVTSASVRNSYATGNVDGGAGTGDDVGALLTLFNSVFSNDSNASYGFGTLSGGSGSDREIHNSSDANTGLTAETLTRANSSTNSNKRWSERIWDFGTDSQIPALKFADYDGTGTIVSCDDFPAKIPGTDIDLVCATSSDTGSLIPGQRD